MTSPPDTAVDLLFRSCGIVPLVLVKFHKTTVELSHLFGRINEQTDIQNVLNF